MVVEGCYCWLLLLFYFVNLFLCLHYKFVLSIPSVNVTKSAVSCGFSHIYERSSCKNERHSYISNISNIKSEENLIGSVLLVSSSGAYLGRCRIVSNVYDEAFFMQIVTVARGNFCPLLMFIEKLYQPISFEEIKIRTGVPLTCI